MQNKTYYMSILMKLCSCATPGTVCASRWDGDYAFRVWGAAVYDLYLKWLSSTNYIHPKIQLLQTPTTRMSTLSPLKNVDRPSRLGCLATHCLSLCWVCSYIATFALDPGVKGNLSTSDACSQVCGGWMTCRFIDRIYKLNTCIEKI